MGCHVITTALISYPGSHATTHRSAGPGCQVAAPGFAGTRVPGQQLTCLRCVAGPALAARLEEIPR